MGQFGCSKLAPCQFQTVLDGDDRIEAANVIGQLLGQTFGHIRIVDTGHIDEKNIFRWQYCSVQGRVDGRIDTA